MGLFFADRVRERTSTVGTGAITMAGAVPGFQTFAGAAVPDGASVAYTIEDGADSECGIGVYASGSNTLTRPNIEFSTHGGGAVPLSGAAQVYISFTAGALAQITPSINTPFRNKLLNGDFRILQRGFGPFTGTSAMTADTWHMDSGSGGGARSVSIVQLSDADRAAIGADSARFALSYTFNGGSGLNDRDLLYSWVENIAQLAGNWMVFSFWAKAVTGVGLKMAVSINQNYGSGGSPSTMIANTGTHTVTLSNSWSRYSIPVYLPSFAGKTLGTNYDDFHQPIIWFSAGTANASQAGSIGVQSGVVLVAQAQLELGQTPSPFELQPLETAFARCLRYYELNRVTLRGVSPLANTYHSVSTSFKARKRTVPTLIMANYGIVNQNLVGLPAVTADGSIDEFRAEIIGNLANTDTYIIAMAVYSSAEL